MKLKIHIILSLAIILSAGTAGAQARGACGKGCGHACGTNTVKAAGATLTETEKQHLQFLREEEKLARDVYNAMYEIYEQRVFSNIPRAEQRHMDAVLNLMTGYDLKDPAKKKAGKFSNKELQKLYRELVKRGSESREAAFMVGALVEEKDILDLQEAIRQTKKEDIRSMYEMLLGGSKRHLNAFVRNYEAASGKTYTAQKMKQVEVNTILGR